MPRALQPNRSRSPLSNARSDRRSAPAGACVLVGNSTILISKDHDFLGLFAAPQGSKLVLLKGGNASNRRLETILEAGWPVIEQALLAGEKRCIEWP